MPLPQLVSQGGPAAKARAGFRSFLVASVLIPSVCLANLLQMLSLIVRPISLPLFRRINRHIAAGWWGASVLLGRWLHGVKVHVSGDPLDSHDNAVIMVNHQSMSDIPVLLDMAYGTGRLGDLKWYVKDVLKYVPGIGWGMLFLDCLFIRRNWTQDQALIEKVFGSIVKGEVPVWIVSFLEGTRMTPGKLEKSQAYARGTSQSEPKHVLIPRTKGFVATVQGLSGHIQAVYDVTIGYVDGVPSLWQWFLGRATEVHVHVSRTPVSQLPVGSAQLAEWVADQYRNKDELLGRFYNTGSFQ